MNVVGVQLWQTLKGCLLGNWNIVPDNPEITFKPLRLRTRGGNAGESIGFPKSVSKIYPMGQAWRDGGEGIPANHNTLSDKDLRFPTLPAMPPFSDGGEGVPMAGRFCLLLLLLLLLHLLILLIVVDG